MDFTINDALQQCVNIAKSGKTDTLVPFLSLLRFKQNPYHLRHHFQMEPIFRSRLARRTVFMTSRQVGKTHNASASCVLRSFLRRHYNILMLQPQHAQTKQLSNIVVKNLIRESYIKELLQNSECTDNVLLRAFLNGSRLHFNYCGEDATRVRGTADISMCWWDECADMEIDVMNVVAETMSAVPGGGIYLFSGTPTFTDNTLAVLFEQSAGGHLHFKCDCGKTNIAHKDHDIYDMIGKNTCICAKCGKPLDLRKGWYEFERPELRGLFDGFHLSQVTHPVHATDPQKWPELLYKREHYPPAQFDNEVLGIPSDEAVKLLSKADLEQASHGRPNTLEEALKARNNYATVALGVDWGGGGIGMTSFTTIAVAGMNPLYNRIDILYMHRIPAGKSSIDEIDIVLHHASLFGADFIAHDVAVAGKIREDILVQTGARMQAMIVPFWYVWAPKQDMLKFHKAESGQRSYYSLDKTRSLSMMIAAIQQRQVLVPEYNSAEGLYKDFLALGEEIREETGTRSIMRMIVRTGVNPDDMAHSVNFCCQALWYTNKSQPRLGTTTS